MIAAPWRSPGGIHRVLEDEGDQPGPARGGASRIEGGHAGLIEERPRPQFDASFALERAREDYGHTLHAALVDQQRRFDLEVHARSSTRDRPSMHHGRFAGHPTPGTPPLSPVSSHRTSETGISPDASISSMACRSVNALPTCRARAESSSSISSFPIR